ncbi:hypothetical protein BDZ91DRAFT_710267 [Kalaharituber pfeilii]|nr:hypothetical protein BDZ91DRAFT_710267 [Kalaharituber pfeilii]
MGSGSSWSNTNRRDDQRGAEYAGDGADMRRGGSSSSWAASRGGEMGSGREMGSSSSWSNTNRRDNRRGAEYAGDGADMRRGGSSSSWAASRRGEMGSGREMGSSSSWSNRNRRDDRHGAEYGDDGADMRGGGSSSSWAASDRRESINYDGRSSAQQYQQQHSSYTQLTQTYTQTYARPERPVYVPQIRVPVDKMESDPRGPAHSAAREDIHEETTAEGQYVMDLPAPLVLPPAPPKEPKPPKGPPQKKVPPPQTPRAKMEVPEVPIPHPKPEYLSQASLAPVSQPDTPHRPILVILDLNGAIVFRSKAPKAAARSKRPIPRPYLPYFLKYLFKHFHVMVWSSALQDNVIAMIRNSFPKELRKRLAATWARNKLGLTKVQMRRKVQVYKELDKIWAGVGYGRGPFVPKEILAGGPNALTMARPWNQTNTILIDDSILKANAQPHNLLWVPAWDNPMAQQQDRQLIRVAGYLETLRRGKWNDVSAFMKEIPYNAKDEIWESKVGKWFWGEEGPMDWVVVSNPWKKGKAKTSGPVKPAVPVEMPVDEGYEEVVIDEVVEVKRIDVDEEDEEMEIDMEEEEMEEEEMEEELVIERKWQARSRIYS